ncbi:hypothetical protein MIMGU_mgv1a023874mg, partial [Erythranthe guttata]
CRNIHLTACNNKLIGVRHFRKGDGTPLDSDGHGTHTSATATGNFVRGANLFDPLAHVAAYMVCSWSGCSKSDILAAMDIAIEDGVDVLTILLVRPSRPFHNDNIAVGAFAVTERGILVSISAGKGGPASAMRSSEALWILAVGASTTDSKFDSLCCGESSLIKQSSEEKSYCVKVGGAITSIQKGQAVKDAGGAAAMIVINTRRQGYSTSTDAHVIPATNLNYEDGIKILAYLNSSSSPTASIVFKGTVIGDNDSPTVASFSSRGPSRSSPGILKPHILGPGVNILAAWHNSVENNTNTKSNFNEISGTSMSCPHLSGVAALLKSAHPDWSPAAIKSAIMTTTNQTNLENQLILDQSHQKKKIFSQKNINNF